MTDLEFPNNAAAADNDIAGHDELPVRMRRNAGLEFQMMIMASGTKLGCIIQTPSRLCRKY